MFLHQLRRSTLESDPVDQCEDLHEGIESMRILLTQKRNRHLLPKSGKEHPPTCLDGNHGP